MRTLPFLDRRDAGRALALQMGDFARRSDVHVLGLPRGGVPVAFEVAQTLAAPLDVCVVRKLGVPGHEEFAMGAIASGGAEFLDHALIARLGISAAAVDAVRQRERHELQRREAAYSAQPIARQAVEGMLALLVDDGLATGATMTAALLALRQWRPALLVAAAPVGMPEACRRVETVCDRLVCPWQPASFSSVGEAYVKLEATSDEEVVRLLEAARQRA